MQRKYSKDIINIAILFVLEVSALIFCYFIPQLFPSFVLHNEVFLIVALICLCLDIIDIWIYITRAMRTNKKNNLKAADIISNDVQEAYYFGEIGLVVTDKADNVLWMNEVLSDRNFPILDSNIMLWKPALKKLREGNLSTIKIEFNNHIYQTKLISEADLYILKDITESENLIANQISQSPVVAIVQIDNFQDTINSIDEIRANEITSITRKIIVDYGKKYDVLLRNYKTDSYLFVMTMEKYEAMLQDNFSIINEVRQQTMDKDENCLTLSIGIGYNFPSYYRLSEIANSALDVALSRGGDQVVISPYGENMIFLGGKTDARTHRNRVKVRTLSKSLLSIMEQASNIIIMGHDYMDLDSAGGAVGIITIAHYLEKKAYIVYDEQKVEKNTRKAIKTIFPSKAKLSEVFQSIKFCNELIDENTLLVCVDVSDPSRTLAPQLVEKVKNIAVIDHHRRGDAFFESPIFNYVEPSASSVSELITEIIRYNQNRIVLPSDYATLLLSGILLDTNYYRNKTAARTYDASMILKEFGASNSQADDFLKEDFEEYQLKNKILANIETPFFGVTMAYAPNEDIVDQAMLAIVANEMLAIKGINASFVFGKSGETDVRLSSRSDGSINCQLLCEKLGGGGHFTAAATVFKNETVEEAMVKTKEILRLYLEEAKKSLDNQGGNTK